MSNYLKCPTCNIVLDGHTAVSEMDAQPQCGDVTVCAYCQSVLQFGQDLDLTEINITDLPDDIQDLIAAVVVSLQQSLEHRTLH